jgi:hypothetical protein
MTFTSRIGRFFVLLGAVLLAIFFASDLADAPRFNLFFWGFFSLVSGILIWRRGRTPAPPSERFRIIRSLRERGKEKEGGNKEDRANQAADSL